MRLAALMPMIALLGCMAQPESYGTAVQDQNFCPGPNVVYGVDVSSWQGGINWGAVAASGMTFAVARVSDGFYVDPYFNANWNGIRAAGLIRGVYQYFEPTSDPVGQANLLLSHIGSLQPGDLPPVLDVEVTNGASQAQMTAAIHAWVSTIQGATGRAPIIYTGAYFWNASVNSWDFNTLPLWLAAYGPLCPYLPSAWSSWTFHQYSSTGAVPGIGGNVDMDKFDGTLADLQALAYRPTCTPKCDGNVVVSSDCSRNDCGASGAECYQDGNGPRCVVVPRGSLDSAACDAIRGWAQDPNAAGTAISVDLYFDGPAGSGAQGVRISAGEHRDDLCSAIGSCDHGFTYPTPAALHDGRSHTVFAYAIAAGGPINPQLGGSPKTFRCPVALAADFDGDHRTDVLQYRSDWQTIPVCRSLGTGWSCENLPARDAVTGQSAIVDGAVPLVADVDGDGRSDVIQYRDDGTTLTVCRSIGTGWSCSAEPATYTGGIGPGNSGAAIWPGGKPLVGDFNADGRADVLQYNATWGSIPVCLSLATGWSCRNLRAYEVDGDGSGNDGSGIFPGTTPLVGDVNGDGRSDIIEYAADGDAIGVCLSLGTGWSCRHLAATYAGGDGAGNHGSGVYGGGTPLAGDFDGDGRTDVLQFNDTWRDIPVCVSLGAGWSCRNLPATYAGGIGPGNQQSGIYGGATPLVGDFDGDGRSDVFEFNMAWRSIPVCRSTGTGWSCENVVATESDGASTGNDGSGVFMFGAPVLGDFDGDARGDVMQYQSEQWTAIPVCRSLETGWSCRALHADNAGGFGPGNDGSGVY